MSLRKGEKTTEELLAMSEAKIMANALSDPDAQPTDYDFWQNAEVKKPQPRESVSLRVPKEVLDWYRSQGKGYQTLINAVLKTYAEAQKQKGGETRK